MSTIQCIEIEVVDLDAHHTNWQKRLVYVVETPHAGIPRLVHRGHRFRVGLGDEDSFLRPRHLAAGVYYSSWLDFLEGWDAKVVSVVSAARLSSLNELKEIQKGE